MSAERFTGYFSTSASKRAASAGEKTDMLSELSFLGLIASTPVPRLLPPDPSLPRSSRSAIVRCPMISIFPLLPFSRVQVTIACVALEDEATFLRGEP